MNAESAFVTLSGFVELQFGVNLQSFRFQQKIYLFFTWSGQSGVPSQRRLIGRQVPSLQVSEEEGEQLEVDELDVKLKCQF